MSAARFSVAPAAANRPPAETANGVLASLVQRVLTWALALLGYIASLWMRPSVQAGEEGDSGPADVVVAGPPFVQARSETFTAS